MNTSLTAKKRKWHFPRITELRYPNQVRSTEEWDNWLKAMTLDRRLSERAKLVLTRLALYLNLKTGRCDPTVRHLAMMAGLGESDGAERMARRGLSEGQRLDWIRRIRRDGGNIAYSQSSLYEFTVPAAAGDGHEIKLRATERAGKWFATRTKDDLEVCGPFQTQQGGPVHVAENFLRWNLPANSKDIEARAQAVGIASTHRRDRQQVRA